MNWDSIEGFLRILWRGEAVRVALLAILAMGALTGFAAGEVAFPLKKSANGRYLVDQNNRPFFIHGDSPWSLIAQLSKQDAERYLDKAAGLGYSAIIVNVVEYHFSDHPPKNQAVDAPFLTPGDFSTPNEAYFAHADWVLRKAAEKSMLVLLFPAWPAAQGRPRGWNQEILKNGPAKCRQYGRYLGKRYEKFRNIIWGHGGDQNPETGSPMANNLLEILLGIRDVAPKHMHFYHGLRGRTSLDQENFGPHVALDAVYTGDDIEAPTRISEPYTTSLKAYNREKFLPHFLFEGRYERQGPQGPAAAETDDRGRLRRQHYWMNLCGSTGHFFGNYPVWMLAKGWDGPNGLGSDGNRDMRHLKALFTARAWWKLVPDQDHFTVTAGYGTYKEGDYVTSARAADGSLVIAYVPATGTSSRTLTVNLAKLGGAVRAQWFNPATGQYSAISGSPFPKHGTRDFTTPGDNGTGKNDWVLVLETQEGGTKP
ncbi:MAG: glycoside hydrolase family 140 protein [Acidobacteria bacterium]|nr:glycoside hydrolase family 140 protein [Acidobacteriota bacterium]